MKIAISGASGFIGRRLLKNLAAAGHTIHVLSRHAGTNMPPSVKVSVWDPVKGIFGALPFIYGTLVTSLIALLLSALFGVGGAIFLAELAPK